MRFLQSAAGLAVLAAASPAFAATESSNDKAVWIALGVVFLGSFSAIGGAILATQAKKRKQSDEN
jgi:hypothetical protein